ncbi:MAG: SDR family NAD(P)-dependent oxidoreductase [Pseudomonadota bacterium]|nr:SDR family NAD(P)-dependent oxidoreductase [Pseudomonadota bacterium]
MRFEGKTAVITAAGAGIGRATSDILVTEGATVVAVEVEQARLDKMVADLIDAPGSVDSRCVDATAEVEVRSLVADLEAKYGNIDLLVNAVGGSTIVDNPSVPIDAMTFEDWKKLIDFNLDATFLLSNAIIPGMKRAGGGKIVNLASIAGRGLSVSSSSAYAAAKGGIIALTRKLSLELGPDGINVNAIAPSLTLTERLMPHWEKRSADSKAAEIEKVPLKRVATARDQAGVIAFLLSADADFVTGLTIDVTGGLS